MGGGGGWGGIEDLGKKGRGLLPKARNNERNSGQRHFAVVRSILVIWWRAIHDVQVKVSNQSQLILTFTISIREAIISKKCSFF